ncbi:hypothetical protein CRE_31178 [Caenorhabditis remanei]|uniref:Uncharacterized protein n=1 Tax=Caenorhabditis remanei TaxID=31234 RepID=E3MLF8_CAERE|nr:hypothetical protein CRE_31178 [Caenorhabditis remanei]
MKYIFIILMTIIAAKASIKSGIVLRTKSFEPVTTGVENLIKTEKGYEGKAIFVITFLFFIYHTNWAMLLVRQPRFH